MGVTPTRFLLSILAQPKTMIYGGVSLSNTMPTKNNNAAMASMMNNIKGSLYPRAGTLGGCTAHNAMITVYPHNSDWDKLAEITGDPSWKSDNMRQYFERLEQCRYIERPKDPDRNPSRHGFDGWLSTTLQIPNLPFAIANC